MKDTLSKTKIADIFNQPIAANEATSGVINSTPIAGSRSHFRSRNFNSFISCNSLMAAANVLLSCNEQLKELSAHDNLEQLHADLTHEIRAFESNAQERGYAAETILFARYVLCATLDETIVYSPLSNSSLWQRFKLISTFQNEQTADERFFLLVDRLLSAPASHIDLLELVYACLSSGFEGKYRYEIKGHLQLIELKDNIYQQIRMVRQDPPKLFEPNVAIKKTDRDQISLWFVFGTAVIAALIFIGLMYFSFAFVFNKVSTPAQQEISLLLNNIQQK